MFDIELHLPNQPGELARMGNALGRAGVSVEGGGMFLAGGVGVAHFLVHDDRQALAALGAAGIEVQACREVVSLRLNQDEPGQLGKLTGAMAEAGVNIEVLSSDHAGQLILLVDDVPAARRVGDAGTPPDDRTTGVKATSEASSTGGPERGTSRRLALANVPA